MYRGPLEVWDLKCIGKHHSHVDPPSPSDHPYKMSHLPTWQLLKMFLHLELMQCRWAENLIMVDKITYPKLSSSPLRISVEYMLILGCNNIALKWQDEDQTSKDIPSHVIKHASPNQSIYDEFEITIIWHLINLMAHLMKEQLFFCGSHITPHAPIRTCNAKNTGNLSPKGHIQPMCHFPQSCSK